MLYLDDCLNTLKSLEKNSVDLIYLDPPFFTQKIQKLSKADRYYEFNDIWESREEYLNYIKKRLIVMKDVLKDSGSIFLHCDDSASWYLKIVMDEVFGEENFQSEIIWTYKRWSNSKKGLLPCHQTIFFYSKTKKYKFNTLFCEYSPTTNIDQIQQQRERIDGKAVYKKDSDGNVIQASEKKGVPLSDVWDIPFLNPKAKERVGYPTQKPIELLDRIIKISTDENDIVLDPFMGSGTTLVSAKLLNRRYIGIDKSKDAYEIAQKRLETPFKTKSHLLENGIESYITKNDEIYDVLKLIDCNIVQRNKGIDAFLKKHYRNTPVAVKVQKKNETLNEAIDLLYKASLKKGCIKSVLITEESAKNIPENMIILNPINIQIEHYLN